MSAYAIAHIQSITVGPPIGEYLERIDATLAPYRGRFLIHGDPADAREGDFAGDLIVIEFPDRNAAVGWYESAAYREILPLRTGSSDGWVSSSTAFPPIIVPPTSSGPAPAPAPRSAANCRNRQPRAAFLPLGGSSCHLDIECLDVGHQGTGDFQAFWILAQTSWSAPLFRVAG